MLSRESWSIKVSVGCSDMDSNEDDYTMKEGGGDEFVVLSRRGKGGM